MVTKVNASRSLRLSLLIACAVTLLVFPKPMRAQTSGKSLMVEQRRRSLADRRACPLQPRKANVGSPDHQQEAGSTPVGRPIVDQTLSVVASLRI